MFPGNDVFHNYACRPYMKMIYDVLEAWKTTTRCEL